MFGEVLIDLLIELPLWLFGWGSKAHCVECGNRLKHVKRPGGKHVQCVMCERVWRIDENGRQHLVQNNAEK